MHVIVKYTHEVHVLSLYDDIITLHAGIRGFANLEDCAIGAVHSLDAFNFLSGLLFLIVIVALLLVMYFKTKHGLNNLKSDALSKSESVLYYLMFILLIISMIMGFCDIVYSFYIASQVFGQYDEFQEGQVNCSSSVYYSSFVSVVIVFNFTFVLFGIALFLCHQTLTCRRTVNSRSNTTG